MDKHQKKKLIFEWEPDNVSVLCVQIQGQDPANPV